LVEYPLRISVSRARRDGRSPGRLKLHVDGKLVGAREAPETVPLMINPGSLACGLNVGSPVTPEYESPSHP
jgi:hypothetical protein